MQKPRRRGHGEGTISKRRDGRWEARIDLGWSNGTRTRKSFYGKTQAEVRTKLQRAQAAAAKGMPLSDDRMTVEAWLTRWLAALPDDLSPNTKSNYDWAVRLHLIPSLGWKRLAKLTPTDVTELLAAKTRNGLQRSSVMRMRSVLVMAIRQAEVEGLVGRNVAALTRNPAATPAEGRSLTSTQATTLLETAKGEPLEIALQLGLMGGLRPGEVLGLTWANVDLEANVLHVRQSLKREYVGEGDGRHQQLRLGGVKTPRSRRSLAMPAALVAALKAHRSRQVAARLARGAGWQDQDLVVTTRNGTPIDPKNYRRAFARMTERAEIGHWKPNELRHSFVSLLHAEGVPLENIADLVGHDGTRMTSGVYRHLVDPVVAHAVEPMDRLFGQADAV